MTYNGEKNYIKIFKELATQNKFGSTGLACVSNKKTLRTVKNRFLLSIDIFIYL